MTVYVGIDASITAAGVTVLAPGEHPRVGVITSKPLGASLSARQERLLKLTGDIRDFVFPPRREVHPDEYRFLIEAPTYATHAGSQHDRSGSWWFIVNELMDYGQVHEVSNTTVKSFAVGKGNAGKMELIVRATAEFPGTDLIDDNGCDSLWIASLLQYRLEPDVSPLAHTLYRDKAAKAVPLT